MRPSNVLCASHVFLYLILSMFCKAGAHIILPTLQKKKQARSGQFAQGHPASELASACCYCCSFASSCSFPHLLIPPQSSLRNHSFPSLSLCGSYAANFAHGSRELTRTKPSQSANQTRSSGCRIANQKQGHCWEVEVCCPGCLPWCEMCPSMMSANREWKLMKLHSRPHALDPRPPRPLLPGTLYCFQLCKY